MIKQDYNKELLNVLTKQSRDKIVTEKKIKQLEKDLKNLINKAITESRKVEISAREETLREIIIKCLLNKKELSAQEFVELAYEKEINPGKMFNELRKMEAEKLIEIEDGTIQGPKTIIRHK